MLLFCVVCMESTGHEFVVDVPVKTEKVPIEMDAAGDVRPLKDRCTALYFVPKCFKFNQKLLQLATHYNRTLTFSIGGDFMPIFAIIASSTNVHGLSATPDVLRCLIHLPVNKLNLLSYWSRSGSILMVPLLYSVSTWVSCMRWVTMHYFKFWTLNTILRRITITRIHHPILRTTCIRLVVACSLVASDTSYKPGTRVLRRNQEPFNNTVLEQVVARYSGICWWRNRR